MKKINTLILVLFSQFLFSQKLIKEIVSFHKNGLIEEVNYKNDNLEIVKKEYYSDDGDLMIFYNYDPITKKKDGEFKFFSSKGFYKQDVKEVKVTIIESMETDQEKIVEIEEVEIEEEYDDIDVPSAVVEDVPIFPGCERFKKSERRKCFQEQMNNHISENFRYPDIALDMGIQGRVYVSFIISKDGSITDIRTRGPDKNLENEALIIISKLPRMIPGKQRGRAVRVPYSTSITFKLN